MQLDLLSDLLSNLPARDRPTRSAPPATLHPHFTITANEREVRIQAPEQQIAERPFQPVAERPVLPAIDMVFRWASCRKLFALYEGCEPLGDHPAAPWLDRIVAAVAKLDGVVLDVVPWCVSWTRVTCRSIWTGLEREDLLRQAESTGCDSRQQALARADAVAARLRTTSRFVVIRDSAPAESPAPPKPAAANGPTTEVRIGALVITVGASA